MLKRILIKDFQKHESLDIRLEPVTVFVGSSDAGKSAILRAIEWVATNKPKGDAFIRSGADKSEVKVKVDSHTVTRSKGKKNTYALDKKEFASFGQSVPEEIADFLNVDSELNFQGQHTSPFWFAETSGEVAKKLNAIANLEVIDKASAAVSSRLRKKSAEVSVLEQQVAHSMQEFEKVQEYPSIERQFSGIEALQEEVLTLVDGIGYLEELISNVETKSKRRKRLATIVNEFRDIEDVGTGANAAATKFAALSTIVRSIDTKLAMIPTDMPNLSRLEKVHESLGELKKTERALAQLLTELDRTSTTVDSAELAYAESLKELELMEEEEVCPMCGQRRK